MHYVRRFVPPLVIDRVPAYIRALTALQEGGRTAVTGVEMEAMTGVPLPQLRKDLAHFSALPKQRLGYRVSPLLAGMQNALGLDRQRAMVLVGAGRLGHSVLAYDELRSQGFVFLAAFDTDERAIGSDLCGLTVRRLSDLSAYLQTRPVDIGVIAVPACSAQDVADRLCSGGVRAVINMTPAEVQVPEGVVIRRPDLLTILQSMSYFLEACVPD